MALAVAAFVGIWFFKTAVSQDKNPWLGFLVGAGAACGGFLWAGCFPQLTSLGGLLTGGLLAVTRLVVSVGAGLLVAASVRANLYPDGKPAAGDILATGLMLVAAYLIPLISHSG